MEKIKNSGIIIGIKRILQINVGENNEILVQAKNKEYYKIIFNNIMDLRCLSKSVYHDRLSQMQSNENVKSSVILIADSKYLGYFKHESRSTIPIDSLNDYLITDDIGCLVEVLDSADNNAEFPKLVKVSLNEEQYQSD